MRGAEVASSRRPPAARIRVLPQFLEHLSDLPKAEQRRVRDLLAGLLAGHQGKGKRVHKVGDFLSFSPTMDIRVLGYGALESLTLVYVDHHDAAYRWAQAHQPSTDRSGNLIGLAEVSLSEAPRGMDQRLRSAFLDVGLPESLASYLSSLTEAQLLDAASFLTEAYQDPVLSAATGGRPKHERLVPTEAKSAEAAEVARWARIVTRRVVGEFLETVSRAPSLRRLWIISPWISEINDPAQISLAQLRKRCVDEGTAIYVVTRPPDHEWHAAALEGFRATRRANVVLARSLHTKLFCADTARGLVALFGSANFTQQSLENREIGLLVNDAGEGHRVVRQLATEAAEIYRSIPDRRFYCRTVGG